MAEFFITFFYLPLYNALIFFVDIVPNGDIGLAIIMVTLAIKLVILPLSIQATKTQKALKKVEPLMKELKEKYKDNRDQLAREMMVIYKEHNIKPLSTLLTALIQLPVLVYLFFVFTDVVKYGIDAGHLYSFVPEPSHVSLMFLGFVAIGVPSMVLAIFAGISQYAQSFISVPIPKVEKNAQGVTTLQSEFARSMAVNVRYILPILITFTAYFFGAAIALYFIVSIVFQILQEVLVLKKVRTES